MREIEKDEEITFDYAMTDGGDYDVFDCECKTASCRRRVTGNDWRLTSLQQKYGAERFSPYLVRRMKAQQQAQ